MILWIDLFITFECLCTDGYIKCTTLPYAITFMFFIFQMSLMNEDDELFKRLLKLNQVIKRLKRFRLQNPDFPLTYEDPYDQSESPYCISEDLENATSSTTSTWSTSTSSQHPSEPFASSKYESKTIDCDVSWDRKFVKELRRKRGCWRKRNSKSDQVSSYDSGIHEPSSDSDHEIFVWCFCCELCVKKVIRSKSCQKDFYSFYFLLGRPTHTFKVYLVL